MAYDIGSSPGIVFNFYFIVANIYLVREQSTDGISNCVNVILMPIFQATFQTPISYWFHCQNVWDRKDQVIAIGAKVTNSKCPAQEKEESVEGKSASSSANLGYYKMPFIVCWPVQAQFAYLLVSWEVCFTAPYSHSVLTVVLSGSRAYKVLIKLKSKINANKWKQSWQYDKNGGSFVEGQKCEKNIWTIFA